MDSVNGLSSASAKRLSGALNEFMRRYPLNRYIVTARRPLPVSLELPNWVELLPLDEYESIDFLIGDGSMRAESAKRPVTKISTGLLDPKSGIHRY